MVFVYHLLLTENECAFFYIFFAAIIIDKLFENNPVPFKKVEKNFLIDIMTFKIVEKKLFLLLSLLAQIYLKLNKRVNEML